MKDSKKIDTNIEQADVQIPESLKGGAYANTINVVGTNSEVTINFLYLNPTDTPQVTLTSRVIVPPALVDKLAETFAQISKELKTESEKKS